jgi:chromosome segregation ATPase
MSINADTLTELINDAAQSRKKIETELSAVEHRLADLHRQRDELRREEEVYRLTLERRFPDYAAAQSFTLELHESAQSLLDELQADNFPSLPRTTAVEKAVEALSATQGFATPADIETYLRERDRSDGRDQIGGALAHLNRTNKVNNVGYGKWVLA